jgi:hypothetical protein
MALLKNSPWDCLILTGNWSSGTKTRKGAIENPEEAFNKTDLIPVGIYAISEDLDSKYVFLLI